jgi:hemolysin III
MTAAVVQSPRALPAHAPARLHPVEAVVEAPSPPVPRLRGVSHEKAFAFAPALGLLLVASAEGTRATSAAAVFAVTMTLMLGVSAANHRTDYDQRWFPLMRRLDHATVNLSVAGTWIAFAVLVLSGAVAVVLTVVVCLGALAASLVTAVWVDVKGWVPTTIGLAACSSTLLAAPDFAAALEPAALVLVAAGCAFHVAGAIVYALRRPNPLPATFAYHEIFHALVVAGAGCHYAALAFFVLPAAS